MLTKILKDLNKLKVVPRSWMRTVNIVKMSITINLIYRFNTIPGEVSEDSFCITGQTDSKTFMEMQRTIAPNIFWKKKKIQQLEDSHDLSSRLTRERSDQAMLCCVSMTCTLMDRIQSRTKSTHTWSTDFQ